MFANLWIEEEVFEGAIIVDAEYLGFEGAAYRLIKEANDTLKVLKERYGNTYDTDISVLFESKEMSAIKSFVQNMCANLTPELDIFRQTVASL